MKERLKAPNIHLTSGASFFILSKEKVNPASINFIDVATFGLIEEPSARITQFLDSNNLPANEIGLVLYSNTDKNKTGELEKIFGADKISDFQKITGTYFTNSAIAMNYGIDFLSTAQQKSKELRNILICNNLISENLGLILIGKEDN